MSYCMAHNAKGQLLLCYYLMFDAFNHFTKKQKHGVCRDKSICLAH